MLKQRSNVS